MSADPKKPITGELSSQMSQRRGALAGRVPGNADHLQARSTGVSSSPPKAPKYLAFLSSELSVNRNLLWTYYMPGTVDIMMS